MFSYVSPQKRVPEDHPLRGISSDGGHDPQGNVAAFCPGCISEVGRPSIPPERLFRALLLQIFYSVRSERLLVEQLQYNLLFRWFVGMDMDEEVWNHAVFSKNREWQLNEDLAEAFFRRVPKQGASQKSFRRKDRKEATRRGDRDVDFHREQRHNDTHQSMTDPEARLYKKSKGSEAKLSYLGYALMENRNALLVRTMVTEANGTRRCSGGKRFRE
jgi:transposase